MLRELAKADSKNDTVIQYYETVNDRLTDWLKGREAKDLGVLDCCLDENNFSIGIGAKDMESIYIVSSQPENEPAPLKGRSNIFSSLERQKELFPSFHIYFLPEYDLARNAYRKVDISKLRCAIAGIMADCMKEMLNTIKQKELEEAK